jgi:signal peptidase I
MDRSDSHRKTETPDWIAMDPTAIDETADPGLAAPNVMLADVGREILAWGKTLLSAGLYATLIVTFGFQIARVDGRSMEPTLRDQDRLVVDKLAYRFADPQPGDIVMLIYPRDPSQIFVKRVVGLPGDTIRIENGRVLRNGMALPDQFIPPEDQSTGSLADHVVEQGHYFVMGDHRNNSSDSREWGDVPRMYILGKIRVRWWPLDRLNVFSGFPGARP